MNERQFLISVRSIKCKVAELSLAFGLGTGSGAWCIQMAEAFPHADVVGGKKTVLKELL